LGGTPNWWLPWGGCTWPPAQGTDHPMLVAQAPSAPPLPPMVALGATPPPSTKLGITLGGWLGTWLAHQGVLLLGQRLALKPPPKTTYDVI